MVATTAVAAQAPIRSLGKSMSQVQRVNKEMKDQNEILLLGANIDAPSLTLEVDLATLCKSKSFGYRRSADGFGHRASLAKACKFLSAAPRDYARTSAPLTLFKDLPSLMGSLKVKPVSEEEEMALDDEERSPLPELPSSSARDTCHPLQQQPQQGAPASSESEEARGSSGDEEGDDEDAGVEGHLPRRAPISKARSGPSRLVRMTSAADAPPAAPRGCISAGERRRGRMADAAAAAVAEVDAMDAEGGSSEQAAAADAAAASLRVANPWAPLPGPGSPGSKLHRLLENTGGLRTVLPIDSMRIRCV